MVLNSIIRYAVTKIINDIINTYGVFSKKSIDDYIYGSQKQTGCLNGEYYELFAGASKLCMVFDSLDNWVVKIPFLHNISRKDNERYKNIFVNDIREGRFGTYLHFCKDLCEEEVTLYKWAVKSGLGEFFSEEKRVMTYHGIPIYVQRKVAHIYNESDRYCDEPNLEMDDEIEYVLNEIDCSSVINDLFEMRPFMEDLYQFSITTRKFKELITFIDDNNINDLHDENIGYDDNGKPVFFDYSGFHSENSQVA